ncbi:sulfatase [Halocalculus aciditolerans]|uniref:Sulfatase N-terminal domain-containing protein n=1 Tax=Halocalculus aciditolerans TaxID=1383812 RepID=A0A830FBW1_9EURY|nr:sulfatase [Halocalculus aciditolerans]GGL59495.1 hypothetical protein GCM10009039_17140 [Halocalculus aciditolerans]
MSQARNVLLVTVDSLRADHVGYHGYERDVTPFIDGRAGDAATFENAFAHVGGTKFAFPSILSGVTPLMYGGYGRISEEQTVVAEPFRDAGYRTGGIHSNLYIGADYGYDRGFDTFFDSKEDASPLSKARQYVKTNLEGTALFDVLQSMYDFAESAGGVNVGSYHSPGDEITDRAIRFIEGSGDQPNFLWVHYMDVHHPFLPPAEYQEKYLDEPLDDRECIKLRRKVLEEPENVADEELQTLIDLYDAEIRYTDDEVERLVTAAEDEWGEDFVFAFTADHGEHFLEHGYFSGAQLYDVKLHVPLLIDGLGGSGSFDDLVALTDLPVTLLDSVGVDVPESYCGHSLVDLVTEGTWPREEICGGMFVDDGAGEDFQCRTDRWKYIERHGGDRELYDLDADPGEQENVADDHPDVVDDLADRLNDHRRAVTETDTDISDVEMEEHVKERLRRLGYSE